jgi:uncharacterized cupredoxin-like copper-binding protein
MSHVPDQEDEEGHERVVLPLVVPGLLFLFAVLVVYGLSRIYIDLNTWHYRAVSMATPLALGVSLVILATFTYLAGKPVPRWQIGFIVLLAAGALTGGATWAAVHSEPSGSQVHASPTPPNGGTPLPTGTVAVTLHDAPFQITASPDSIPPGSVTFAVSNTGNVSHNFHIIKTDLALDKLPIDSTGFSVDLTQVNAIKNSKDIDPAGSDTVAAQLDAGKYVLICNVPSHYQSGMRVAFTVQ